MGPLSGCRPSGAFVALVVAVVFSSTAFAPVALAQSSASYHLSEHTINAAGHPAQGTILISTGGPVGFRIRLDAAGEPFAGLAMASAGNSLRMQGGFVAPYPPPGEVTNLRFAADTITLSWNAAPSNGGYSLYRGLVSSLPGLQYGQCEQAAIASTSTTDAAGPSVGTGYFYLVTARNSVHDEGTKGYNSAGVERPNPAPCP